ncbi:hypothetical protein KY290_001120 [Solanum tuberosum]|uniref:RNase H type-1 domain-containing protein n=1 Tax=Solanum tuberosum TaxID=4113 RepID=A0ABQ7WL80_SOLTU|nr:hypothetical protein KY290_001120 [Solanum tuberosum]
MAIQLAAEICVHKGFTNVVIETDSTIARLIMIQEVSAPREGNVVADSLANYAIDEEIFGTFEEFHQLPAQASLSMLIKFKFLRLESEFIHGDSSLDP